LYRRGAGENHLSPRAEPKTGEDSRTRLPAHQKICPPTVRLEIEAGHGAEAYLVSPTSARARAALRALKAAFGCRRC